MIPDTVYLIGCLRCGWTDLLVPVIPQKTGYCIIDSQGGGCGSPLEVKATYRKVKE